MFPLSAAQVQEFTDSWGIHPQLSIRLLWAWWQAHNAGVRVTFLEGHRTLERQAQLYAQGRTTPGEIVTQAKPGQSKHNEFPSRAMDVEASNQEFFAHLAKSVGVQWGGDWKSFKDRPHFQWGD